MKKPEKHLSNARAVIAVNLENGGSGDFQHLSSADFDDITEALAWIDSTIDHYDRKHPRVR